LPALLEGRIDGCTIGQPWISVALRSPNVRVLAKSFSAIAPRFLMTAYFSTAGYATANAATLATFARVVANATRYANAHPAQMAPLIAALTKQDPSVVAGFLGNVNAIDLDPKLIQPMIDATARYRVIAKPFPAAEILNLPAAQPAH
jgi:NitT/TauT family transport system substrate-binding protein